jgi:putative transcriptional regulator
MPVYHPTKEQVIEFSSGSLPMCESIVISAHMYFCQTCSFNHRQLNTLGGILLDGLKVEETSKALKTSTLKVVSSIDDSQIAPINTPSSRFPHSILDGLFYNRTNVMALEGWSKLTSKISILPIMSKPMGTSLFLLKAKAGAKSLMHGHKGKEIYVILEGALQDEYDAYKEGDYIYSDECCTHISQVPLDTDSLLLAYMDNPPKIKGFLSVFNPLVKSIFFSRLIK